MIIAVTLMVVSLITLHPSKNYPPKKEIGEGVTATTATTTGINNNNIKNASGIEIIINEKHDEYLPKQNGKSRREKMRQPITKQPPEESNWLINDNDNGNGNSNHYNKNNVTRISGSPTFTIRNSTLITNTKTNTIAGSSSSSSSSPQSLINAIPKKLFKILLRDTGDLPLSFVEDIQQIKTTTSSTKGNDTVDNNNNTYDNLIIKAHQSWSTHNPDYTIYYYDLVRSRHYLQTHFHPVFLRTFDCIIPFAIKVDFLRMCFLYKEGGYYSDWKEVCYTQNLLTLLSTHNSAQTQTTSTTSTSTSTTSSSYTTQHYHSIVLFEDRWVPSIFKIQNSFLGSSPRHPVIAAKIKLIMSSVQSNYYGKHPHDATGPSAFTKAYKNVYQIASDERPISSSRYFAGYYNASKMYYKYNTPNIANNVDNNISGKKKEGDNKNDRDSSDIVSDSEDIIITTSMLVKETAEKHERQQQQQELQLQLDKKRQTTINERNKLHVDDIDQYYNVTEIVLHKCHGCGEARDSIPGGNDYIELFKRRQYYCQDHPTLFNNQSQ